MILYRFCRNLSSITWPVELANKPVLQKTNLTYLFIILQCNSTQGHVGEKPHQLRNSVM